MKVPDGGGGGGGGGGGHGAGTAERWGNVGAGNSGQGLTWKNYTMEDGNAIMDGDAFDESEDMDMVDSDRPRAQGMETSNNNVSSGFLFPPATMARAISPQTDPSQAAFRIGSAVTNEVGPSSILTGFSNALANFSHTDIPQAFDFSGTDADQLDLIPNLDDPLEDEWLAFPNADPFGIADFEFPTTAIIPHEVPDAGLAYIPTPEFVAPGILAQAACAGGSPRQHQSGRLQSGLALSGQFQTQIQPPAPNDRQSTSTASDTVTQLPENQHGPRNASTFGIARGIFPGFFSNPTQGDDGSFGW